MYRVMKSQEEYFGSWKPENLENLTADLRAQIYARYVVKCMVFQRDGFKCKHEGCKTPESKLTLHHIKFRKNNGEDKLKNCVTICKSCHQAFHRGKAVLTFDGATYRIHKGEEKVNWKKVKADSKVIRKDNREHWRAVISWELLYILMKFLEVPFYDMADSDDD